jgi:two-component system sensor histidine kinase VanS
VEAHKTLAQTNPNNMTIDIPEDLHCYADIRLLRKALSNIILNSIQNTSQTGRIDIYAEDTTDGVRLSILNPGYIDEELLPRLFEPFYRMDKARSRKQGKTGLGLTIVKKSLDIMKINFGLENTKDGVLFWMILPKD